MPHGKMLSRSAKMRTEIYLLGHGENELTMTDSGYVIVCVHFMTRVKIPKPELGPFEYNTYGVTVTEAELDVLTGENVIRRVDVLYDCGER